MEILQLSVNDPQKISFDDTRILLAAGLKHEFHAINANIAGRVLNETNYSNILMKIGEALGAAFSGTVWEEAAFEDQEERAADKPFVTATTDAEPTPEKRGKKL